MQIAIIGAGFSGLASAWFLLQKSFSSSPPKITIFDPLGIGGGASGVAAGLMHPFVGLHSKLNFRGEEGIKKTEELIKISTGALKKDVAKKTGLLRVATDPEQIQDYTNASKTWKGIDWLTPDQVQEKVEGISYHPGIFIHEAFSVDTQLYLQGLWKACEASGTNFVTSKINDLNSLSDFDLIIVTAGFDSQALLNLPLLPLKGQLLQLGWPPSLPPLPFPISSKVYILMDPSNEACWVGATFERKVTSPDIDIEFAKKDLLPKAFDLLLSLKEAPILQCKAAIRSTSPQKRPLFGCVGSKTWYLTAMSAKGLLYHAIFAQDFVNEIKNRLGIS